MLEYICRNFHVVCFIALALLIGCRMGIAAHKERRAAVEQAEQERAVAEVKRRAEMQHAAAQAQRAQAEAARKQETERKRAERAQAQADKHAVKVARAMELAELKERALNAEKELRALRAQPVTAAEHSTPAVSSAPVSPVCIAEPSQTVSHNDALRPMVGVSPDEFLVLIALLDATPSNGAAVSSGAPADELWGFD